MCGRLKADLSSGTLTHFEVVVWFNHVLFFNRLPNNIIRHIARACHEKAATPNMTTPNTLYE